MSGLPMRAKYRHFPTMCEHTCDNSPNVSNSSIFELMIVHTRSGNFAQIVQLSCLLIHTISPRISSYVLPCHRTKRWYLREVPAPLRSKIRKNRGFLSQFSNVGDSFFEYTPSVRDPKTEWVLPDQLVSSLFPTYVSHCLVFTHFDVINVDRDKEHFLTMHEQAFQVWNVFPTHFD